MIRAITSWPSGAYGMLNGQEIYGRTSYNFGEFYYYSEGKRISRRTSTTTNTNSPVSEQVSSGLGPDSSTGKVRCVKDNPNAKHSSSSDFNEGGEV